MQHALDAGRSYREENAALTLSYGGNSANPTNGPLVTGATLNVGDTLTIPAKKMEVSVGAGAVNGTFAAGNASMSANCPFATVAASNQPGLSGSAPNAIWNGSVTVTMDANGNTGASNKTCTVSVTDSFNEPFVTATFDAAPAIAANTAFPPVEQIAMPTVDFGPDEAGDLCLTKAYYADGTTLFKNQTSSTDPAGNVLAKTDNTGCLLNGAGTVLRGGMVAYQQNGNGLFTAKNGCKTQLTTGSWTPNSDGAEPGAQLLSVKPINSGSCTLQIDGVAASAGGGKTASVGVIVVAPSETACLNSDGSTSAAVSVQGTSGKMYCVYEGQMWDNVYGAFENCKPQGLDECDSYFDVFITDAGQNPSSGGTTLCTVYYNAYNSSGANQYYNTTGLYDSNGTQLYSSLSGQTTVDGLSCFNPIGDFTQGFIQGSGFPQEYINSPPVTVIPNATPAPGSTPCSENRCPPQP